VFGIALLNLTIVACHNFVGNLQQRLNINERPIANKYCEGKMKSTLKRR